MFSVFDINSSSQVVIEPDKTVLATYVLKSYFKYATYSCIKPSIQL